MADIKISGLPASTTPLAGTEVLPVVQSGTTKQVSVANLTAGRSVATGALTVSGILTAASGSGDLAIQGTSVANANWRLLAQTGNTTKLFRIHDDTPDVDRLTIDASGNVNIVAGNIVQGTAAKGINFTANTPAAGMTSQLLNWYEEGTWTPVVAGSSTAGTYQLAASSASYTRIGRQVTLIGYVQLAAVITGGGAGALTITGVPFAKAGGNYAIGTVLFSGVDYTAGANLCCSFGSVSGSSTIYFEETNDNAASSAMQIGGVSASDYIFFSITYWA